MSAKFVHPVFEQNIRREQNNKGTQATCCYCGGSGVVGQDVIAGTSVFNSGISEWWTHQECASKEMRKYPSTLL
jgi:hypothetical protein